eukprot:2042424-Prorocentrum_lima.AAC.1
MVMEAVLVPLRERWRRRGWGVQWRAPEGQPHAWPTSFAEFCAAYADDLLLVASDPDVMRQMLDELFVELRVWGVGPVR